MKKTGFWISAKKDDFLYLMALDLILKSHYSITSVCRKAIIDFAASKDLEFKNKLTGQHIEVQMDGLISNKRSATRNFRLPLEVIEHFKTHNIHKSLNALVVDLLEQKMTQDLKSIESKGKTEITS